MFRPSSILNMHALLVKSGHRIGQDLTNPNHTTLAWVGIVCGHEIYGCDLWLTKKDMKLKRRSFQMYRNEHTMA